jgi:hypothetical protein
MSGLLDRVNWESNERVDIPDMRELTRSVAAHMQAAVSEICVRNNDSIIFGFTASLLNTTTVRITRGTGGAFIGRDPVTGATGYLFNDAQGAATRDVDFSQLAPGTYDLYINITLTDGTPANRAFWSKGTSQEFPDVMNTRQLVDWEAQASIGSPGASWVAVAQVVWDGSLTAGDITDTRVLLFETEVDEVTSTAGIDNYERDPDRSTYHLSRLIDFVHAVLRELQDIKSNYWDHDGSSTGHSWFTALPTGLSLRSAQSAAITVGDGTVSWGNYNADDPAYSGDAALAVQDAIDALPKGGVVVIKPGTYTWQSTVAIPDDADDQITVVGHGIEATRLSWSGTPAPFFRHSLTAGNNVTRFRIGQMTMSYSGAAIGQENAVEVDVTAASPGFGVEEIHLHDVEFLGAVSGSNGHVGLGVVGADATRFINEVRVERCKFNRLISGLALDQVQRLLYVTGCHSELISYRIMDLQNVTNAHITNCHWQGRGTNNIPLLWIRSTCSRIEVSGCTFADTQLTVEGSDLVVSNCIIEPATDALSPQVPLHLIGVTNAVVENCVLLQKTTQSAEIGCVRIGGASSGVKFHGNVCVTNRGNGIHAQPGSGQTQYAIEISDNVLLENGYDNGNGTAGTAGVYAHTINGLTLSGNTVFRVGATGINLVGCTNAICANNMVLDDDAGGGGDVADRIMVDGIALDTTSTRVQLVGNAVVGTRERGLAIGASTQVFFNANLIARVDGGTVKGGVDLTGSEIVGAGNAVLDCTGYGISVGGDRTVLSGCLISSPTLEGLKLAQVQNCSFSNIVIDNAGTKGVDASSLTGTTPIRFTAVAVYVCGTIAFDMAGRPMMSNCLAYNPGSEALNTAASTIISLSNFEAYGLTNGGSSTFGIDFGTSNEISWSGGHLSVHATTPPTTGVAVDTGCKGTISDVFLSGDDGMTIGFAVSGQVRLIGCTVDEWAETGISVSGNAAGSKAAAAIGCSVLGGPTSGGYRCIRVQGAAAAIGCDVHPGATVVGIECITGEGGTSLVKGNAILGSAGSTTVIDVTNTSGALITDNRSPGLAGLIDLNSVAGDCLVLGNILGGSGADGPVNNKGASTLPATMANYNF